MPFGMRMGMGLGSHRGGGASLNPVSATNNLGEAISPITHGGYDYIVFTTSGKLKINKQTNVDFMLLGGGGGSNSAPRSGGGGAGGCVASGYGGVANINTVGEYTITVGGGGAVDARGGFTKLLLGEFAIQAEGGGAGGGSNTNGLSGGCGGGGGGRTAAGGTAGGWARQTVPATAGYTAGYGNAGGGKNVSAAQFSAHGGGGVDSPGLPSTTDRDGGNGGGGKSFEDIWDESGLNDALSTVLGFSRFGGGGGGCGHNSLGVDGGGNGAADIVPAGNGTNGTGGGGGGRLVTVSAGTGGSGLCVVRYAVGA
jgi:hypothetical protein